ncbi:MAG: hypothetical protein E7393_01075 [Ruminococcaceae bacterium]|nr:hypothetical protein [Oscillospiraceae bacterium]
MTTSQLKEILKHNILNVVQAEYHTNDDLHEHIHTGANILLAKPCLYGNDEEGDALAALFEIAADKAFVAGQIVAPKEALEEEGGLLPYEAYYQDVLSKAEWLIDMGVSMIFLTGFRSITAMKCAVYAVREADFDIPICFGIYGEAEKIAPALSLLVAAQSLDICAFGCVDMDIEDALFILSELQAFTTVPLFALATFGQFLTPELYGDYVPSLINQKCAMLGLGAGSPAFTAAASKALWQLSPLLPDFPVLNAVCSRDSTIFLDFNGNIVSRNKQMIEIKTEKAEELLQALPLLNKAGVAPVCFSIQDIDLLEYAISHYAGRPAVRTDEYGAIIAKELGAFILSDNKGEDREEE